MYTKQDTNTGKSNSDNMRYIYLHENGDLIVKSIHANPLDFEESDFVKRWWKMDLEWRGDIYNFLISAKLSNANPEKIQKWINDWKVTNEDTKKYLEIMKLHWSFDNNIYHVWYDDKNIKGESEKLFDALYNFVLKTL